jgi:hypothetical protein
VSHVSCWGPQWFSFPWIFFEVGVIAGGPGQKFYDPTPRAGWFRADYLESESESATTLLPGQGKPEPSIGGSDEASDVVLCRVRWVGFGSETIRKPQVAEIRTTHPHLVFLYFLFARRWLVFRVSYGRTPKGFLFAVYLEWWAQFWGDPFGNFTTPPPPYLFDVG